MGGKGISLLSFSENSLNVKVTETIGLRPGFGGTREFWCVWGVLCPFRSVSSRIIPYRSMDALFALPYGPVLIFALRIVDVSMGTCGS